LRTDQIKYLLLLLIFSNVFLVAGNSPKVLAPRRIEKSILIDGRIDSIWSQADSISDFVQYRPYHGLKPSRKTVVKTLTSDDALFCLIICYDNKENIHQSRGKLDDQGGDVVSIMLDTFNNRRTAYKFAVTAAGVRSDCILLDDARNRDYSWDGIWFSDATIYDWGFVVEIKIPYKSIQYNEELSEWGLDFDRWVASRTEDIYWNAYEENEGQRVSKFGKLVFQNFSPSVKGKYLEIYPVGISKTRYHHGTKYFTDSNAGIDIFYNPSAKLTFQFTANPDFAQIEADPFDFNITRYETYFDERRPFFTEGNEIFMASGRQRNSGFYRPMELFYSRRIGKKLPDGTEVPLLLGTKAFGRIKEWEYGSFLALTGATDYTEDEENLMEDRALFGSMRLKKQIYQNSSVGFLFVGKHTDNYDNGVFDIDGAFRTSSWQLAYQIARSYKDSQGDFASSAVFLNNKEKWITAVRGRYVGEKFEVDQVGFIPWKGTGQFVSLMGPRWYFEKGYISQILVYGGGILNYEKIDAFTDYGGLIGFNMQFRNNWGYEINFDVGESKEEDVQYTAYNLYLNSWINVSPKWNGNINWRYSKSYNFSREYLAYYFDLRERFSWLVLNILEIGTTANIFIEGNPEGKIEDITYNTRPYFSVTPINDLNIRLYVDNVFVRSTGHLEEIFLGFLFSYNFSPKSWIYFALNEVQDRTEQFDAFNNPLPDQLRIKDRVGVFKIKYLYYF